MTDYHATEARNTASCISSKKQTQMSTKHFEGDKSHLGVTVIFSDELHSQMHSSETFLLIAPKDFICLEQQLTQIQPKNLHKS